MRIRRAPDGTLEVDRDGRAGGRGAYVCRNIKCLQRAMNVKTLKHVFRMAGTISPEHIDRLTHYLTDRFVDVEQTG